MVDVFPVRAFRDNYIWLVANGTIEYDSTSPGSSTSATHCAIIDPGDATPVLNALNRLRIIPVAILVTHHHWDHVGGVQALLKHVDMPVYGPAKESIPGCTQPVCDGDLISLPEGLGHYTVIEVPGHTAGHVAYHGEGALFCGDTLFGAGCGRLFEGTPEQMFTSLHKLAELPTHTNVYCAHEYTLGNLRFAQTVEPENTLINTRLSEATTLRANDKPTVPFSLENEKSTNPFLRSHVAHVKAAAERYSGQPCASPEQVFTQIRRWKDNW